MTKTLIIKIGAIGDAVMALPIITSLTKNDSDSRITWVCGKAIAPLLNTIKGAHEIIEVDDKKLLTGNLFQRLMVLIRTWIKLFARRYDLVLTAHSDKRYRLLSLFVLAKERRAFSRAGQRIFPVPGRYHGYEYARLVTGEDGPEAGIIPLLQLKLPLTGDLKALLSVRKNPAIALAPGGAKNVMRDDFLRRWPLDSYVRLAKRLIKSNMIIIITGSDSDSWINDKFKDLSVINLVGRTKLPDLIAVYGHCDLVVSHDSAPLHLALLAGAKVVGLFGPTNPNEKLPLSNNVKILWGGTDLACRPCYDGQSYAPCQDNRCLKEVQVDEVFSATHELLFSKASRGLAPLSTTKT